MNRIGVVEEVDLGIPRKVAGIYSYAYHRRKNSMERLKDVKTEEAKERHRVKIEQAEAEIAECLEKYSRKELERARIIRNQEYGDLKCLDEMRDRQLYRDLNGDPFVPTRPDLFDEEDDRWDISPLHWSTMMARFQQEDV